jgi:hypothetical protein
LRIEAPKVGQSESSALSLTYCCREFRNALVPARNAGPDLLKGKSNSKGG